VRLSLIGQGILRLKGSFIHSLYWKPFDKRYDDLLKRWQEHKDVMDHEMSVSSKIEAMNLSLNLQKTIDAIEQQWTGQNEHTKEKERILISKIRTWTSKNLTLTMTQEIVSTKSRCG